MAHMAKYGKGSIGALIRHDNRLNKHYSNELIDPSKTHLNKQFCDNPMTEQQVIDYAESFMTRKRKDANYLCSWVISKPMDLKDEDTERFFSLCHQFLCDRYGYDNCSNIVSSALHMDESNPHLHFLFVPIAYDKNKDKHVCSAKKVVAKKELQEFHPALNKYIDQELGYHVELMNGKTLNKSMSELKEERKAQEQYKAKIEEIDQAIVQSVDKFQSVETSVPEATMFNRKEVIDKQSEVIDQLQQVNTCQQELINEQAKLIESYKRCEPKIDHILASNEHKQVVGTKRLDIEKKRLDELETSIDKTQSLLEKLDIDNPALQHISDEDIKALGNLSSQPKEWLVGMVTKLINVWQKLSKSINALRSKINSLTQENKELKSYQSLSKVWIDNMENTNKELESSNQALTKQVSTLQSQYNQLKLNSVDMNKYNQLNNAYHTLKKQSANVVSLADYESLRTQYNEQSKAMEHLEAYTQYSLNRNLGIPLDKAKIVVEQAKIGRGARVEEIQKENAQERTHKHSSGMSL